MESQPLVNTRGLTKRYGSDEPAVADLDLTVNAGEVYGFLGRNGAGKTTTLRMLVGLIRPTAGTATVLGAPPGAPTALARLGALIEVPAFYPHLSGLDNLRLLARYSQVPDSRVQGLLDRVGLADRGRDRFRAYSLGMKQRLGLAASLLKDPELLVLDEPTNGLDPPGITDLRQLLRDFAAEGRAVLLSSHLLGEVEQSCDRVGVIQNGRLIAEGSVDQLRARAGGAGLIVRAEPAEAALACLRAMTGVSQVAVEDQELRVGIDPARAGAVNRELVTAGVTVMEIRELRHSLEDIFLDLTRGDVAVTAAEPTRADT